MKLSNAREKFLFKTKIYLELNEDGTSNEDGDFIVLREPTFSEMQQFGEDTKKNIETLEKLFPLCLVDHSFIDEADNKSSVKEVVDFLKESGSLYGDITNQWFDAVPFNSRLKKQKKSSK
jgi:hypothetical protein